MWIIYWMEFFSFEILAAFTLLSVVESALVISGNSLVEDLLPMLVSCLINLRCSRKNPCVFNLSVFRNNNAWVNNSVWFVVSINNSVVSSWDFWWVVEESDFAGSTIASTISILGFNSTWSSIEFWVMDRKNTIIKESISGLLAFESLESGCNWVSNDFIPKSSVSWGIKVGLELWCRAFVFEELSWGYS